MYNAVIINYFVEFIMMKRYVITIIICMMVCSYGWAFQENFNTTGTISTEHHQLTGFLDTSLWSKIKLINQTSAISLTQLGAFSNVYKYSLTLDRKEPTTLIFDIKYDDGVFQEIATCTFTFIPVKGKKNKHSFTVSNTTTHPKLACGISDRNRIAVGW